MDRDKELVHLAFAEKAVAAGERHVLLQEQRVADLDRDGHDTKRALETLAIFRRNQSEHVAYRDLILKMLQQDAAKPKAATGPMFRPGHNDASLAPDRAAESPGSAATQPSHATPPRSSTSER